jgi:hypothetical protein
MKPEIKAAIEKYQCPGCVAGMDTSCFEPSQGVGCGRHCAGTRLMPVVGLIWLGMPTGFNRLGPVENNHKLYIWESLDQLNGNRAAARVESVKDIPQWYDKFNVPVWKHRTKEGHVLVRGLHPRTNAPFSQIILSDEGFDQIPCAEITEADIAEMN